MKKIMAVIVALMFVSAMAFSSLAFAGGPAEKGKAPMSDHAKDGKKVSEDAKAKNKNKHAKMDKKDKKDKDDKEDEKEKKDH